MLLRAALAQDTVTVPSPPLLTAAAGHFSRPSPAVVLALQSKCSLSLEDIGRCDLAVGRCWWHLSRLPLCLVERGRLLQPTTCHALIRQLTLLPLNE